MNKILSLILTALISSSNAQEVKIKTEIVTIALDEFVEGKFFNNGEKIADFAASATGISEVMEYEGPQKFVLRYSKEEFSQDAPPAPAATVNLPADTERVLLACIKTKDKPMKLVAYDIGASKTLAGDYRIFNFSQGAISVILGTEKKSLKAGTNETLSNNKWKKEIMELEVLLGMVKEKTVVPVYSSQWGHRPGRRNYIFVFDSPLEYNPLHICRYYDVPPKAAAKEDK